MKDRGQFLSFGAEFEHKSFFPFWYQEVCLEKLDAARAKGKDRALIVMATGLGKTAVAAFDVQKLLSEEQDARVLFLCHQSDILRHGERTFKKILGGQYRYGHFHGGKEASPLETDILFATFQKMRLNLDSFDPDFFDYIVVDESHHSKAETFESVVSYFHPRFMLAQTATPDRMDLQNIRELFGKEVYSLPLEKALALGLLTKVDYRLMSANVDPDMLEQIRILDKASLSIRLLDDELFQPQPIEEVVKVINEVKNQVENPRVMIFTPSIEASEQIAEMMEDACPLHSKLRGKEQERIFESFRQGQIETVTVVDKFNEGVDIPHANIIVFLRSTNSSNIFYQQLGRGLRKVEGKRQAIVLDFVGNCARIQMVNELWTAVQREREETLQEGVRESPQGINMDIGQLNFSQVTIDILDIIGKAQQDYSQELIINMLQNLSKTLDRTPTRGDVRGAAGFPNPATIERKFGTFNRALKAAGLEPVWEVTHRTDGKMLEDLFSLYEKLGRVPTRRDLRQAKRESGFASYGTYQERFGKFSIALERAGIISTTANYRKRVGVTLSDEEMVKIMQDLIIELGKPPTARELRKLAKERRIPSDSVYERRFGSFADSVNIALESLGRQKLVVQRKWGNEELLEGLRHLFEQLGRLPKAADINDFSIKMRTIPKSKKFEKRFGSIRKALVAAGLLNVEDV